MAHQQLTHVHLQAIQPNLFGVATALRLGIGNHGDDIVDLSPATVCRNAVAAIRYASPVLEKGIIVLAPFAILVYGVYRYVWKGLDLGKVVSFIRSRLVASVTISAKYNLHAQVMDWMAKNNIGVNTRSVTVHSNIASSSALATSATLGLPTGGRYGGSYEPHMMDMISLAEQSKSKATSLSYVPAVGSTAFSFNGHSLWIHRRNPTAHEVLDSYGRPVKGKNEIRESDITISCYSIFGGVKPVQEFLEHITALNEVKHDSVVRIVRLSRYIADGNAETWDHKPIVRPARNLDSVSMEDAKKQELLADISAYLSPESKLWYANRGIPWRRGYLFYGPPGTGKTSFCTALAGHFNMPLYILSLSNSMLSDTILETCFDSLPTRCIVLVEDVDSAGMEREKKKSSSSKKSKTRRTIYPARRRVTLAGLLNTIDGPVSHEGRVLVMTTNSPDNLDAAMLRPGRIDKKVLFGNASPEVIEQLFLHIYEKMPSESEDKKEAKDKKEATEHDLPALAKQFSGNLPEDQLSPAEIQNFLLEMRQDPVAAVNSAREWSESVLRTKNQGRNVEQFRGQVGADVEAATQLNSNSPAHGADGSSRMDSLSSSFEKVPASHVALSAHLQGASKERDTQTKEDEEDEVTEDVPGSIESDSEDEASEEETRRRRRLATERGLQSALVFDQDLDDMMG